MKQYLLLAFCFVYTVTWVVMAQDVVFSSFPSMGPKACAVPTFTVSLSVPTPLPTLPAGTKRFTIRAEHADIIAHSLANVATAGIGCGIKIQAGTSRSFDTATTTPPWYFLASGSVAASATIDVAE